ncbi:bestrophin family protein [Runella zeae]|jgi:putative membrane protein|uniref:bestrophin family protein n=1 Tax=Runella zeae TaxID=94255 RepID=UPI002351FA31|nr:bestrophin family ion channel [Runella zeae]
MITYNPKDWWKLIFAFHRSDTFMFLLPGILGVAAYTGVVAYIENDIFHASFKNTTVVHSLVGFVLSMLLVFRTNTAYERWWEGRKIWGSFVNNSRNLSLKLDTFLPKEDNHIRQVFRILISNYVYASKEHLRAGVNTDELEQIGKYNSHFFNQKKHVPNQIMGAIYEEIHQLYQKGVITGDQLFILNEELRSFTDNIGACERIKRTPIPYAYSLFLKKVIFLYVFTMPIGFVIEFKYWAVPIVAIIFYVFASIEVLAEEIEDPFGTDANDLPTDTIYNTIHDNLSEILK